NPDDYFGQKPVKRETGEPKDVKDNVVKLPTRNRQADEDQKDPVLEEIETLAKPRTKLNKGLNELYRADAGFSPKQFLSGANMAYEMIVNAFADGDHQSLKNLLSREVYEGFKNAIDERQSRGDVVKSSFVGIDDSEIKSAEIREQEAQISVRFESQIVSVTFDKDGKVIDGDENEVARVSDIWTFARDLRSNDPNWKLVATEAEG
ncbi:MAG: Tim44/TimA family putative adaptor protein, partial [Pseudomonadota bacterium]